MRGEPVLTRHERGRQRARPGIPVLLSPILTDAPRVAGPDVASGRPDSVPWPAATDLTCQGRGWPMWAEIRRATAFRPVLHRQYAPMRSPRPGLYAGEPET